MKLPIRVGVVIRTVTLQIKTKNIYIIRLSNKKIGHITRVEKYWFVDMAFSDFKCIFRHHSLREVCRRIVRVVTGALRIHVAEARQRIIAEFDPSYTTNFYLVRSMARSYPNLSAASARTAALWEVQMELASLMQELAILGVARTSLELPPVEKAGSTSRLTLSLP